MNTATIQLGRRLKFAGLLCALTILSIHCQAAGAEGTTAQLGRLFFTPERRQDLDRQRQLNIQEQQQIPEDTELTINGVVTRSSGKRTVWINGVSQGDNDVSGNLSVTPSRKDPGRVILRFNEAPVAHAKVGETVNRDTGESTDLLNGGRLQIHVQPQAPK